MKVVLGTIIQDGDYSMNRVLPFAETAQKEWLRKYVGPELNNYLNLEAAGELAAEMGVDYVAEDWTALMTAVKRVICWGCFYEYIDFSVGTDTGNGLTEDVSENSKPVRLGILEKRKRAAKINLGREIEEVMAFLFTNRDSYVVWRDSDSAQRMLGLFVRSAVELDRALPESMGSWWLYRRMLEEYVTHSESVLVPVLQQAVYDAVVVHLKADTLVEPYKQLRKLAANFLSFTLYLEVFRRSDVVLTDEGTFRVLNEFDGINNAKTPTGEQINRLVAGLELSIKRAEGMLRAFLAENAGDIEEYVVAELTEDEQEIADALPFQKNRLKERKRVWGM